MEAIRGGTSDVHPSEFIAECESGKVGLEGLIPITAGVGLILAGFLIFGPFIGSALFVIGLGIVLIGLGLTLTVGTAVFLYAGSFGSVLLLIGLAVAHTAGTWPF